MTLFVIAIITMNCAYLTFRRLLLAVLRAWDARH